MEVDKRHSYPGMKLGAKDVFHWTYAARLIFRANTPYSDKMAQHLLTGWK